jgi:hypothetical protein
MKKLISICLLVFLTLMCNAQEKNKSKYSELNQVQLTLEMKQSKKAVWAGRILTLGGLSASFIGISMLDREETFTNQYKAGGYLWFFGTLSMLIGTPIWISGAVKRHNIKLEMVKFYPPGSASIYCIGLKIQF